MLAVVGSVAVISHADQSDAALYSGSCGASATWSVDTSTGVLIISGTGAMTDYTTGTDMPWYDYRTSITSVVIDSGIISIGSQAFYICSLVTSASISSTVTTIGNGAFYHCVSLTSITIPSSVTAIGSGAFTECTNLTSIIFLGSQPTIGDVAFSLGHSGAANSATIYTSGWASDSVFTSDIIGSYTTITYLIGGVDMSFTSPAALDAMSGATFSYTPSTNISGCTFVKTSGVSWLTMTSGVLSGTIPTVTSVTQYQAVITATSPAGQTATQTITINAYPVAQLSVESTSVTTMINTSMSVTVSSNIPCDFSVYQTGGSLPTGLSISDTGVISGTPTVAGSYSFYVYGFTSVGPSQSPTILMNFTIVDTLSITSSYPSTIFVSGNSYSYTPVASISGSVFTVSGLSWLAVSGGSVVGSIPSGLTSTNTYTYTLTATYTIGSVSQTATQTVHVSTEPVLSFSTIPTASCIVIPVYTYNNDGTYNTSYGSSVSATTYTYKFIFTGTDTQSIIWNFGDGTTSTDWSPIHTYDGEGLYDYTVTATNEIGSSQATGSITVLGSIASVSGFSVSIWMIFGGLLIICLAVTYFVRNPIMYVFDAIVFILTLVCMFLGV